MRFLRRFRAPWSDHDLEELHHRLDERRQILSEVKARTPNAEEQGALAQRISDANGFTRSIAASMERKG